MNRARLYLRGLIHMTKKPTFAVRKRRQALLRKLPSLVAILRGSLIDVPRVAVTAPSTTSP
jgi:hypothetical protein